MTTGRRCLGSVGAEFELIFDVGRTFRDASDNCASKGAILGNIDSQEEFDFVKAMAAEIRNDVVNDRKTEFFFLGYLDFDGIKEEEDPTRFTGASRQTVDTTFFEKPGLSPWHPTEPVGPEQCVAWGNGGSIFVGNENRFFDNQWLAVSCNAGLGHLCRSSCEIDTPSPTPSPDSDEAGLSAVLVGVLGVGLMIVVISGLWIYETFRSDSLERKVMVEKAYQKSVPESTVLSEMKV